MVKCDKPCSSRKRHRSAETSPGGAEETVGRRLFDCWSMWDTVSAFHLVSTKPEALSSERRNTSAMMSAVSAEVSKWEREWTTGTA